MVSEPKDNVNACDDFLTLVVKCHFLTVVMKKLGMEFLDDIPTRGDFTQVSWMMSDDDRRSAIYSFSQDIIKEYVHLPMINTDHSYIDDKVLDYAKEVMSLGMFYLNYKDAVREGDGGRILTLWKYLLPIFKVCGRRNYSVEVLSMLSRVVLLMLYKCYFVYSPRQSKQLLWSRFINVHGVPGKNIAADLHMEHLNRVCKEAIKGLGANKTPKAISRIGNAMGPMYSILDNFDRSVLKATAQGRHKVPNADKDVHKVICQLQEVLKEHKTRYHSCFPKFKMLCHQFDKTKLKKWTVEHIESWQ